MTAILNSVDNLINSITMYRLVQWGLRVLAFVAVTLTFLNLLPFSPWWTLISIAVTVITCMATNFLFARVFKAPANVESAAITGLILFFIFSPPHVPSDLLTLVIASSIAMASKYLFAIKHRHLFNPAAFGAVIMSFVAYSGYVASASWWVGSTVMLPFVLILGIVILHKIRKFTLFSVFALTASLAIISFGLYSGAHLDEITTLLLTSWPIIFFGSIMLIEPETTPPTKKLQILYGFLVGTLFASPFHLGPIYFTPELALVIGNVFSFLVGPRKRLTLTLTKLNHLTSNIYEFIFTPNEKLSFAPGQYAELTFPHLKPDSRGVRRFFTISSSPTEAFLSFTMRIDKDTGSSFKKALLTLPINGQITLSNLAGDFTLPKDTHKKLLFIAGGIGVTPFRSMVKKLIDTNTPHDITLILAAASTDDLVFLDLFKKAESLGVKVISVTKRLALEDIKNLVPDFSTRTVYLSGPNVMVNSYKEIFKALKVPSQQIVIDFFPGY